MLMRESLPHRLNFEWPLVVFFFEEPAGVGAFGLGVYPGFAGLVLLGRGRRDFRRVAVRTGIFEIEGVRGSGVEAGKDI